MLGTSALGCNALAFPSRAPSQAPPPLPQRLRSEGLGPVPGLLLVRCPGSEICLTSPSQTEDSSGIWAPSCRLTPTSTCTSNGCLQIQHAQNRLSLFPPQTASPVTSLSADGTSTLPAVGTKRRESPDSSVSRPPFPASNSRQLRPQHCGSPSPPCLPWPAAARLGCHNLLT